MREEFKTLNVFTCAMGARLLFRSTVSASEICEIAPVSGNQSLACDFSGFGTHKSHLECFWRCKHLGPTHRDISSVGLGPWSLILTPSDDPEIGGPWKLLSEKWCSPRRGEKTVDKCNYRNRVAALRAIWIFHAKCFRNSRSREFISSHQVEWKVFELVQEKKMGFW